MLRKIQPFCNSAGVYTASSSPWVLAGKSTSWCMQPCSIFITIVIKIIIIIIHTTQACWDLCNHVKFPSSSASQESKSSESSESSSSQESSFNAYNAGRACPPWRIVARPSTPCNQVSSTLSSSSTKVIVLCLKDLILTKGSLERTCTNKCHLEQPKGKRGYYCVTGDERDPQLEL